MFYVRQHNIPLNEVPVIIPELLRSYVIPSSVSQSWPILCDAINCSPLDSSVLAIFQARNWVVISFSKNMQRQMLIQCTN